MSTKNFLIGPINDALRKDMKPWATPEDSFDSLVNAYQFRGRLKRRQGYSLLGQLAMQITNLTLGAATENFTANLFTAASLTGAVLVSESTTITVDGALVYTLNESMTNPGTIVFTSGTGTAFLNGTINYNTGALALNFSANPGGNVVISFVYAYMLPVMGLRTRELFEINAQATIGFDTKYSYIYSNTNKQFQALPSIMPVVWSGTNWQFFFTTNYAGAFWATNSNPGINGWVVESFSGATGTGVGALVNVTATGNTVAVGDPVYFVNIIGAGAANNLIFGTVTAIVVPNSEFTVSATSFPNGINAFVDGSVDHGLVMDSIQSVTTPTSQDGIRYYASTSIGTTWVNYNPPVDPNNVLAGALLIFPYRGYLVFLNTTEGNDEGIFNYGNRARWTQIGTPYYSQPVPTTPTPQTADPLAARDDLFGRGGANDAPTQEVIVGAAFIRDILIVFFERSTWRLRFVNNAQNPFVWERINVELGASATFSTIPFDKGVMAIGERGIVIADANDTVRFDEKIPDSIFEIRIENDGMQRVCGIRTFRTRLNYWTYPSSGNSMGIFPDKVLVYNYDTKNWSFFDDCFTTFGYFYTFNDRTWADLTESWSSYNDDEWSGGDIEANYESIIAGNQQGFVLQMEQTNSSNGSSLYLTAVSNGSITTPATFTSPNNNLVDGTWIILTGAAGITEGNGVTLNGRSFKLVNPGGPSGQPDTFTLQYFSYVDAGAVTISTFTYQLSVPYIPVFHGSVNIYVGTIVFTDSDVDGRVNAGMLMGSDGSTGTIDYLTGAIVLNFVTAPVGSEVYIYVVSQNPNQEMTNLFTTGTYAGGGYIAKISNIDIRTKIFNFLPEDKRCRLNRIDFYVDQTPNGEFTCNVFGDSSNVRINQPLLDNPRSNVVETTVNRYQIGQGAETIFRLYVQAVAQTVQLQLTMTDQQLAVPVIRNCDIEILAMNFELRRAGRLI